MCLTVIPFAQTTLLAIVHYNVIISLVEGLWLLPLSFLDSHTDSFHVVGYSPVSWRSCSFGSVGMTPSHAPAVHRWSRCWGRTTQIGLVGSWVGQPASSPAPVSLGPVLLCCPGKVHGPLSQVLQQVRGGASSWSHELGDSSPELIEGQGAAGRASLFAQTITTAQGAGLVQHNVWISIIDFGNKSGSRHQHRAQLQQDHGPRHDPWCQPSPQTSSWPQVVVQAPHIPLFLNTITSLIPHLTTAQEPLGFLSHLSPHTPSSHLSITHSVLPSLTTHSLSPSFHHTFIPSSSSCIRTGVGTIGVFLWAILQLCLMTWRSTPSCFGIVSISWLVAKNVKLLGSWNQ